MEESEVRRSGRTAGDARPRTRPETGPVRVQLRRSKGWRMPPNTVKVDRSTRWGNPFIAEREPGKLWRPEDGSWVPHWGMRGLLHRSYRPALSFPDYRSGLTKHEALSCAIARFSEVIAPLLDLTPLRGKNLACWCPLDAPCHADVLLEIANRPPAHGAPLRQDETDASPREAKLSEGMDT